MKKFSTTISIICIFCLAGGTLRADTAETSLEKYNSRIDAAVNNGLTYLKSKQLPDGSFICPHKGNAAVTSLAIMAFLAKGYTPSRGPYSDLIDSGLGYILSCARGDGVITSPYKEDPTPPMYSHCISTLLLCEVSGMVSGQMQNQIDSVLPKALRVIIASQNIPKTDNNSGGWRYTPTSRDSDISCTGWAVMALRSAKNNGAGVPISSIDAAIAYILKCRNSDGGFAYQPQQGSSGFARTGLALLCLELCGQFDHPAVQPACDYLLNKLPQRPAVNYFYYGLYYASQGLFQVGGNKWVRFARWMYDLAIQYQKPDGSWPRAGGSPGQAGEVYSTAMTILALSVSYRQLPIYQR